MSKNKEELLKKEKFEIDDLLLVMDILRGDNGCPWDREQNHKSIRMNFIEEVYEACEGIDNEDDILLKEELGDVLLQVVFHSRIAQDEGAFNFSDVCDGVVKKLIYRHPHIFGDVTADTSDKVLANWDELKVKEKGHKTASDSMDSVAKSLPSLMRCQKVQKKAAKEGFDFKTVEETLLKLNEEYDELADAVKSGDICKAHEELGDLIFSAVNVARFIGADSESVLDKATDKFIKRYKDMEVLAEKEGKVFKELSFEEQNILWDKIKIINSNKS